jgi:septal ring factor EnvC (AmiA/AmiB activator)
MPIRPRRGGRARTPWDSSSPVRPARGRIGLAAGLALALVLTTLAASADAQSSPARPQDPRAAREQVRKQRAAVARNVDALRASQREVERALDTLDANVKTQQRLLKDAEGDVADAEAAAADARRRADEAAAQVDELARRATEVALSAYARGSLDDALGFFDQRDATDAVVRQTLAEVAGGDAVALADRLRAAREDLKAEEAAANAAAQRADDKRRAVEQRIAELRDAQEEAEAFADRLESRLDAALSEAASLAQLDATYSRQIEEQTRALARSRRSTPTRPCVRSTASRCTPRSPVRSSD